MKVAGKFAQQSTFITQILYPLDKLTTVKSHAYLIGWNLEQFKCLVHSKNNFYNEFLNLIIFPFHKLRYRVSSICLQISTIVSRLRSAVHVKVTGTYWQLARMSVEHTPSF